MLRMVANASKNVCLSGAEVHAHILRYEWKFITLDIEMPTFYAASLILGDITACFNRFTF